MPKTIEQRLYEAYRAGSGIRLSADDVDALFHDEAIGTVVTNTACEEAGVEIDGHDRVPVANLPTWRQFVESMK